MEKRSEETFSPVVRPDWAPVQGHVLRLSGVHFDAVRVHGVRGEHIAERYVTLTCDSDADPGPVICEATGFRWLYFLLPPGTAGEWRWPPGLQLFGSSTRTVTYVGVPALDGNTWPLRWCSPPTRDAPFVDAARLHSAACAEPPPPARPLPCGPYETYEGRRTYETEEASRADPVARTGGGGSRPSGANVSPWSRTSRS